uniref:DUF3615 domain-containing protein n=1 Tax=Aegilops tauschii TaxID=37682 RepID=N1R1S0_AEGTA
MPHHHLHHLLLVWPPFQRIARVSSTGRFSLESQSDFSSNSCNDGSDDDVDIGDPFLTDRFGNLTSWRLSDLEAAADNYLENEETKKAGSTVLFFAEVTRDKGQLCNVLCCKPLDSDDNGHCFGCKNQGYVDLRHPAGESLYVGGHVDCEFPFMWDSISEDDSD